MRAIARTDAAHPRVSYKAGSAAALPVADGAADLALMFLVWHHVPDKATAAAEIARVLRPGARLLIAGNFADRLGDLPLYRFFPRAKMIDAEVYPTLGDTVDVCARAGLAYARLAAVRHRSADSLAAFAERQRLRAYSVYEHLTDAEYADGMAALEAAAAAETDPAPVESDTDLLVLTRA
jgi:ubiquinone/menaquinone biosynthesis C-methylase UbiE